MARSKWVGGGITNEVTNAARSLGVLLHVASRRAQGKNYRRPPVIRCVGERRRAPTIQSLSSTSRLLEEYPNRPTLTIIDESAEARHTGQRAGTEARALQGSSSIWAAGSGCLAEVLDGVAQGAAKFLAFLFGEFLTTEALTQIEIDHSPGWS